MASIFLTAGELKGKRPLPTCCVVCGAKKAKLRQTQFAIVAEKRWSVVTGQVDVTRHLITGIPLCDEHQNFFNDKYKLMLILVAIIFIPAVFLVLGAIIAATLIGPNGFFLVVPAVFLVIVAIFVLIILLKLKEKKGVHASEMNYRGMRLENVDDKFVDAVEDLRYEYRDEPPDRTRFKEFTRDD